MCGKAVLKCGNFVCTWNWNICIHIASSFNQYRGAAALTVLLYQNNETVCLNCVLFNFRCFLLKVFIYIFYISSKQWKLYFSKCAGQCFVMYWSTAVCSGACHLDWHDFVSKSWHRTWTLTTNNMLQGCVLPVWGFFWKSSMFLIVSKG